MMTKKDNRRYSVRRARRALNSTIEFAQKISGKFINSSRWGSGLKTGDIRTKYSDDPRGGPNDC